MQEVDAFNKLAVKLLSDARYALPSFRSDISELPITHGLF